MIPQYNIEKSNVFNNSETYEIELEIKPIKEVLNKTMLEQHAEKY